MNTEEIKNLLEKITPGKWEWGDNGWCGRESLMTYKTAPLSNNSFEDILLKGIGGLKEKETVDKFVINFACSDCVESSERIENKYDEEFIAKAPDIVRYLLKELDNK